MRIKTKNYWGTNLECEHTLNELLEEKLIVKVKNFSTNLKTVVEWNDLNYHHFSKPNKGKLEGFAAVRPAKSLVDLKK